ncbi:MAG: ATP-binding protein [Magnetococcus sp. YQC-5]
MNIDTLIRLECPTVDAYAGIDSVEQELLHSGFLVVKQEGTFFGLLVADDILEKQHTLVIDCVRPKPVVDLTQDVQEVFGLMKSHRLAVLPVMKEGCFHGVITQTAILEYCSRRGAEFEQQIASYTQELMETNAQLRQEILDRREAEARANAANQAKSNFLANISHEIRTPLHIVIGFSQILEERIQKMKPEKVIDHLRKIQAAGHHLLALVNQILDLSQIEASKIKLHPTPMNLCGLLENLTSLFQNEARKKGNRMDYACDPAIGAILADTLRLRQVLINLLSNANKFTENGEIFLRAHLLEEKNKSMRITFSVEDTGVGMPAETICHLFEPFFQGDESIARPHGGVGLGLSICKNLVEQMGGTIVVQSRPDEGCVVQFTLNCPSVPQESTEINGAPGLRSLTPARCLLIEDDPVSRTFMEELLAIDEHQVMVVDNGQAAFLLLEQHKFDLILTDLRMPDMDGLTIIQRIRALPDLAKAATPILVLTADAVSERLRACLDRGANGCITKPMELDRLRRAMARLLAGESFSEMDETIRRSSSESPVLDPEILHNAMLSLGRERVLVLGEQFKTSSSQTIREMEQALLKQNQDDLREAAHRMVGCASHMGFRFLVALSQELETQAHDPISAATITLVDRFKQSVQEASEQLEQWFADTKK